MRRSALPSVLVTLIFAIGSISCGAHLDMSGPIGEWRGAPPNAHSAIFLNATNGRPKGDLVALDGVEALLHAGASDTRAPSSYAQTTSDAGGHFRLGLFAWAGRPRARVTFRKPGFEPVEVETLEARLDQVVVALVRER